MNYEYGDIYVLMQNREITHRTELGNVVVIYIFE